MCDPSVYQPPSTVGNESGEAVDESLKNSDKGNLEDSVRSFSSTSSLSSSASSSVDFGPPEIDEPTENQENELPVDNKTIVEDDSNALSHDSGSGTTDLYFDRSSVTSVLSVNTMDDESNRSHLQSKLSLASNSTTTSSSGSSGVTTVPRPPGSNRSSLHGPHSASQPFTPRSPLSTNLSTAPLSMSPNSPSKTSHPQLTRASGWLANAFASSFQNRSARPNSTSGSGIGSSPRTVTPPKFHSLDSHMEQQRTSRQQSIGSGGPHAPPGSPNVIARQAASLDRGVSLGTSPTLGSATVAWIQQENSNLQRTNSAESSPTLSRALSISSVFSRTESLASSMQNLGTNLVTISTSQSSNQSTAAPINPATPSRNSLSETQSLSIQASPGASQSLQSPQQTPVSAPLSAGLSAQGTHSSNGPTVAQATSAFFDRFAKEAKGLTREAIQATKHEISVRRTSAGATGGSNFEFGSEQFNGLADKTSSMLSGLFSGKMVDKVKEKVQQQQAQFGGAFPSRKGLVERTQLIKHGTGRAADSSSESGARRGSSSSSRSNRRGSGAADARAQEADNQQFLKEICQSVLNGDGIGWLRLGRLRKLMEDENYRNFVVCRVNGGRERLLSANDQLDDVAISKAVWKGMSKLLQALVHGIEQSRTNSGQGGLQSTLQVLEIAHTHYWTRTDDLAPGSTAADNDGVSTLGSLASSTVGGRNSELSSLICGLNNDDASPCSSTIAGSRSLASTTATSPFGSNEALNTVSETCSAAQPAATNAPEALSNAYEIMLQQQQSPKLNNKLINLPRIASADSESSDLSSATSGTNASTTVNDASDRGSMTLNPAYFGEKSGGTTALGTRSTCSDSEVDGLVCAKSLLSFNYSLQFQVSQSWHAFSFSN